MATTHLCPGYRITTSGVDCGKAPPSISRAPQSPSNPAGESLPAVPPFGSLHGGTAVAQHNSHARIQLHNLPTELIDYIFSFLDKQAPSSSGYTARPSLNLTHSRYHPLKCLSLTCKDFRLLTVPRLFVFACLDPATLTDFLRFVQDHDLGSRVQSIVAILGDPDNYLTHPLWWARLLKSLKHVVWFSLLAPPATLGSILSVSVPQTEVWAFNMPYHLLRLHRPPPLSTLKSDSQPYGAESSLFSFCDWDELVLNEGSSLKAYSLYEYFLRETPSSFAAFKRDPKPEDRPGLTAAALFKRLQSFTYIAIFPFYNHAEEILKHVRDMTTLKTFVTQLSTRADVDAISDEHLDETKKVDMNDCWMELMTAYDLILHTVLYLAQVGQLQRWEAKDASSISAINDELVPKVQGRLGENWVMEGGGVWARAPKTSPTVEEIPDGTVET